MNEVAVTTSDELVMKLLHYFITEQNYNPIILQGAKNEIWLENVDQPYPIVRIVTNYIHNDEQFEYDIFKTKKISSKIKRKLLSFNTKVFCFYLNLGDNVTFDASTNIGNITYVRLKEISELDKYNKLLNAFPNITEGTNFKEDGLELFMKLTMDINRKNEQDAKNAEDVFQKKTPYVTYALIGINVLIFFIMTFLGGSLDAQTLVNFGANYKPLVISGQWYRLVTSIFLHAGLIHLLANMYSLYVIGPQLESFYGRIKFILIYLFSGICGSLLSIVFSNYVSVGASGAIFGLLGSLLYFGYHYRVYLGGVIRSQIIPLILLNLGIGFMVAGIDNAAHIGGLIGGVFMSMALGVKYKSTINERVNGFIISIVFVAFLIYMSLHGVN